MELKEAYCVQMKSLLGEAGFLSYQKALEKPWQRGLRLNLLFCPDGMSRAAAPFLEESVPWARGAYFVEDASRPGVSPLHEAGLFYLQEPSAMVPVSLLDPKPGEKVLDLCAAPGGKSTQIAGLMAGRGLLVSNEPVPNRAQILSRNLERLGVANSVVTVAMPEDLSGRFEAFFDRILVDAPCSGEGMFRRQPEAMEEWDAEAPARCAERQRLILQHASRMLKPGGRLVYSTCTFNRTENEETIASFLCAHPEFRLIPFELPGLPAAPSGMLHLYPHEIRGEGHFAACLQKEGELVPDEPAGYAAPAKGQSILLPEVFAAGHEPKNVTMDGDVLRILPDFYRKECFAGIRVLRTGLLVGHAKGKRTEPDHALALSMRVCDAARTAELTEQQALLYQAGEALDLGDLPSGYTLLCHQGKALGWGKQAGGLMKNHYPKGLWRRS